MAEHVEGVLRGTVDGLISYLVDRVSVQLVGPHSSGRSELLGLVSDRLDDDGYAVLRLFGNRAWRHEPFAALSAGGIGPASSPGPRRSAGEMTTALAQQLRAGRVVLVCDDADDLDAQSIGALLSVHRQHPLVALTSSRPQHPVQADSLVLGLSPAVRMRIPMLDADQVHEVCRRILGGPVDAFTLARITTKSGGLHGLVKAIATVGRQTGVLAQLDGLWTAPGLLWSEHLTAVVEPFLAGAEQATWDAATTLAVTGPIPMDQAQKLLERSELDPLLASGLAHYIDDGASGVVGLYPPLLADYLRNEGSAFGVVRAQVHTGTRDLTPLTPLFEASTAVGADAAVLSQQMVRRAFEQVAQHRRVWQVEPTPEAALLLVAAQHAAAAPAEEIEEVIRGTPLGGDSDAAALLVAWYATWSAVDRADLAGAYARLKAHEPVQPAHAGLLRATRAHLMFLLERMPSDDLLLEAGGDESEAGVDLLTAVRLETMIASGQVDRARKSLRDFNPRISSAAGIASCCASLADVMAGDLNGGINRAREELGRAYQGGGPGLIQAQAYVAILGLTVAGRLEEASRMLSSILSSSTLAAFSDVFHTGLLVVGADVASLQGRPEYARTLAAQAVGTENGQGPYPGMVPPLVEALSPDVSAGGGAHLWDLVDDRIERGYLASAVVIAVGAVNHDRDPGRALRLCELAGATESPLLRALGHYVVAAASDDVSGLAASATELSALGAMLYAVRARVSESLALRRAGQRTEAAERADDAWRLSSVAGAQRSGLFTRLVDDVGLSARESEILHLLASPMSTADVARAFQMSVRTAETHLHNASRKIGVTGREQLLRATTTWLRADNT